MARKHGDEAAAAPERPGGALAFVRKVLPLVVLAALLVHPTQVTVRQWADALAAALGSSGGLARVIPPVRVCVSDILFAGAFVLWLALNATDRRLLGRLRHYPLPLLAVLLCAALSAAPFLKPSGLFTGRQLAYGRAARELVQLFIFFGCTYLVLADYMREAVWRRRLTASFLCAAAFGIAVGVRQYARLRPSGPAAPGAILSPADVDGPFGFRGEPAGPHEQAGTLSNRNVLGAWASLVVPIFWALALCLRRPLARASCGVAAAAGLLLLLQGGLWLATIVALLVMAYVRGLKSFAVTAAALFVFWAVVFRFAPEQHGMVLLDSVALHRSYDRFHTLPLYGALEPGAAVAPARLSTEDNSMWQQKFIEWQPGLAAAARSPVFGVGLGNYQSNINAFYAPRPDPFYNPDGVYDIAKPVANLMESGANSFYLVWLVETGFVGLFALLWLLVFSLGRAAYSYEWSLSGFEKGLGLGSLGALCAMAGGMLFANYLVRGVGVAAVFVLATAVALSEAVGGEAGA
jgi:hypothetical protein